MLFVQMFEQYYDKSLNLSRDQLSALSPDRQVEVLFARLQQLGLQPLSADSGQIRGLFQVCQANAMAKYQRAPEDVMPVPVVLFRPVDRASRKGSSQDSPHHCLGWSEFSDGLVDVYEVPGDHRSMMVDPNVQHLAERLTAVLAQTRSDTGGKLTFQKTK
jgi:thioesterase domain-containing protein